MDAVAVAALAAEPSVVEMVPLVASLMAAEYMLWVPMTMAMASTFTTTEAMAMPLPAFLPRSTPTSPTTAKTRPMSARKNDRLLTNGKNEVSKAMMPSTRPTIAAADLELGVVLFSTISFPSL